MNKQTRVVLFAALTWVVIVPTYTVVVDPSKLVIFSGSYRFENVLTKETLTAMFLPAIVLFVLYAIYDKFVR